MSRYSSFLSPARYETSGVPAISWSQVPDPAESLIEFNRILLADEVIGLQVKRIMDVAGSIFLFLLLSPLFFVIAILIKATSRGPVFFKQPRIGQNWEPFFMYKFRTMKVDAPLQERKVKNLSEGRFFKIKNDPRVTDLGKFLRKYSLDELPQLINVLQANMSLVGPRPLLLIEFPNFQKAEHFRRFSMKPGLTCIWQVNGRNNTTDDQRLRYDLQYVDHWSLALDVQLLLKTIPVVIGGDGAY